MFGIKIMFCIKALFYFVLTALVFILFCVTDDQETSIKKLERSVGMQAAITSELEVNSEQYNGAFDDMYQNFNLINEKLDAVYTGIEKLQHNKKK